MRCGAVWQKPGGRTLVFKAGFFFRFYVILALGFNSFKVSFTKRVGVIPLSPRVGLIPLSPKVGLIPLSPRVGLIPLSPKE